MISSLVNKFASSSSSSVKKQCNTNTNTNNNQIINTNTNTNSSSSKSGSISLASRLSAKSPNSFFKYHRSSKSSNINNRILKQHALNLISRTNSATVDVKPPSSTSATTTPTKLKMNYSSFMYAHPNGGSSKSASSTPTTTSTSKSRAFSEDNENNIYENENATAQSIFATTASNNANQPMELELEKICLKQQQQQQKQSNRVHSEPRFADEPEYRMEHPRRGYAIIINNKYFDSRLEMPAREGTDRDAMSLEISLSRLGFDTKLFNNCTASSMRELLLKYAKTDHWDSDCFLCVLLSHGENGVIYAVDKELEIDALIQPFKFNRSLAGKPKLFFVQACRGSQYMEGIDSNPFAIDYVSRIPMEADFLIAYSTVAGYYSWRNSNSGSWFIQSLCAMLDEYGAKLELMQLLIGVNRRVAYFYESNTDDPAFKGKKQVPCIVSMLTKELYFKPKNYIGSSISIAYN